MEAITDVRQYRVTDANPPSSNNEVDYERCAALHNHVVELGWVGSGRSSADIDRRTWWDYYGDSAEDRLAPSLINFLQRAIIGSEEASWSWHYFLAGLIDPESFFEAPNYSEDELEGDRFIWLYLYGRPLGHTNGLM
jgi:hypothetical protein